MNKRHRPPLVTNKDPHSPLYKAINCAVLQHIPAESDNIGDYIDLPEIMKYLKYFTYYLRSQEECPFNRGNWIIDIELIDGSFMCYKYPKQMTKERFDSFMKPLTDLFQPY